MRHTWLLVIVHLTTNNVAAHPQGERGEKNPDKQQTKQVLVTAATSPPFRDFAPAGCKQCGQAGRWRGNETLHLQPVPEGAGQLSELSLLGRPYSERSRRDAAEERTWLV